MAPEKAMFIVILLAVATIREVAPREIPEFLHICDTQMETPKYEKCVVQSIENLQTYMRNGVPEYNIPRFEPLRLKRLIFAPTNSFRVFAKDIDVYGASHFKINKLKVDFKTLHILVDVFLPNLLIEGMYEIDGKILLLPIRGSGPFHGNATNSIGSCRIKGERIVDKDGMERVHITDFKMKITVEEASVILDNLFNGDQMLGDVINSAINSNIHLFLREILPLLDKALSDAFKVTSENIVSQFSLQQLFPNVSLA